MRKETKDAQKKSKTATNGPHRKHVRTTFASQPTGGIALQWYRHLLGSGGLVEGVAKGPARVFFLRAQSCEVSRDGLVLLGHHLLIQTAGRAGVAR